LDNALLEIKNLHLSVENKELMQGFNLNIKAGEIHVLMGSNGSGKSSLAMKIMGSSRYVQKEGHIIYKGQNIDDLNVEERAQKGIFLSFQNPQEVVGLNANNFFKTSLNAARRARGEKDILAPEFFSKIKIFCAKLDIDEDKIRRNFNVGFSGGEKKKIEILQMLLLEPELIILDEPDSGLDVDALKIVAQVVNDYLKSHPQAAVLLITHYNRLLKLITPTFVHLFLNGRIEKTGGAELANLIEEEGYGSK